MLTRLLDLLPLPWRSPARPAAAVAPESAASIPGERGGCARQAYEWMTGPYAQAGPGAPSPVPWVAQGDAVRDREGDLVALVCVPRPGRGDTLDALAERRRANTLLLAAAPQAVVAVRDMLGLLTLDECPDGLTDTLWEQRVRSRCEAVLRAVEG